MYNIIQSNVHVNIIRRYTYLLTKIFSCILNGYPKGIFWITQCIKMVAIR